MYMRDEDVARRFGVARSTIWRWVQLGLLKRMPQGAEDLLGSSLGL